MNLTIEQKTVSYSERILKLENMLQSKKVSKNWKRKIEKELDNIWETVALKDMTFFVEENLKEMRCKNALS